MWYSNLYRRHLLDMHVEDWNPDFLSEFSPQIYVNNLKRAGINYAMLYLQSHVGLCYFPTRSGVMHSALTDRPDLMKRTAALCHEEGIRVCGYYSLIYNTREHDRHPQWRMRLATGLSWRESSLDGGADAARPVRYGFCCPNHPEYRQFVFAQIDEMLDYVPLDAMFFDMPFWGHTCYCTHCQRLYRAAYGEEMPIDPEIDTPEYQKLSWFKGEQMGLFVRSVTDYVKSKRPDMPVEHNIANSASNDSFMGCWETVAQACDYVGGDLYGNLYNHSFACKYFGAISKMQPFEQMFSRCKPTLGMHTLTKSLDEMKTAIAITMAHHGATLVIDAIDPVGTMDERVYARIGEAFDFQKPYEPYFTGEMLQDIGIYYGMRSRSPQNPYNNRECCKNLGQTLIRAHIPFGATGCFGALNKYPMLAAPMLSSMEEDIPRLTEYVRNGGTLYLSGFQQRELVTLLTGHIYRGQTQETSVYLAPQDDFSEAFGFFNQKYPLPFEGAAPIAEPGRDCTVIATLTLPYTKPDEQRFASIHSNPPGIATNIPAITCNRFGKGTVLWSALPLEAVEYPEYRQLVLNLFSLARELDPAVLSDAPGHVELTTFRQDGTMTVNAAVLCEETVSISVDPFTVKIKTPVAPTKIVLLPEKQPIAFRWEEGRTIFTTQKLHIFDMYQVIF